MRFQCILVLAASVGLFSSPNVAKPYFIPKLSSPALVGIGFGSLSVGFPSKQEEAAADTVAAVFARTRDAAHLPKLERIGGNMFREKACKHDQRLGAGLIDTVEYQTSDPYTLPGQAQEMAGRLNHGVTVVGAT